MMSHIDKIEKVLNSINCDASPNLKVDLLATYIRIEQPKLKVGLEGENKDFYNNYISGSMHSSYDYKNCTWNIDKPRTVRAVEDGIIYEARRIFERCSPAKAPRRTKVYKSFNMMTHRNVREVDFMTHLMDICEYYNNVGDIRSEANDVHRKNIFKLLCLMEKNYGETEKKSN